MQLYSFFSLNSLQFNLFQLHVSSLEHLDFIAPDDQFLAHFGDVFIEMKDHAGQGLIVVRHREIELVGLVEVVYFQACREHVGVFLDHFFGLFFLVIFIFDLTKNLLYRFPGRSRSA